MSCEHRFEWHLPGDGSQYGRLECLCVKCGQSKAEFKKEQEKVLNKIQLLAKIGESAIAYKKAFDLAERINQDSIECDYQNDETGSLYVSLAYNKSSCLAEELGQLIKIYEKEYSND